MEVILMLSMSLVMFFQHVSDVI